MPFSARMPAADALLLAHQAEQDVLGADVVVEHALRFLGGVAEDALALRGERDVHRGRDLVAVAGRGPRSPCGSPPSTGGSWRRSARSGPCLPGSGPGAGARSRSNCCPAGSLRSGRRRSPAGPARYSARTSCFARPLAANIPAPRRLRSQAVARHGQTLPDGRQLSPSRRRTRSRGRGQALVVGDHDDGDALLAVERRRRSCRRSPVSLVEVAGRLVGQQGAAATGPGPGPPPPAAARRRTGRPGGGRRALAEPHLAEQRLRACRGPRPPARARDEQRHHHVLERGELGQQVVELEDEAEGPVAERAQAVLGAGRRRPRRRRSRCPLSGRSRVPSTCSRVDFPTPEAPTMATISPRATSRSSSVQDGHVAGARCDSPSPRRARDDQRVALIRSAGLPRDPARRRRARDGWWPGSR